MKGTQMIVLVFDVETTGLPEDRHADIKDSRRWPYVVQLSWLLFDLQHKKILSCDDHIIRLPQGKRIPAESTAIHGITNEKMVAEGEEIAPLLTRLSRDLAQCTYIVAHNIDFDKTMIRAETWRNGHSDMFAESRKVEFCTMKYGEPLCGLTRVSKRSGRTISKFPRLSELHHKLFGQIPGNLHNSLVDVLVCFRCFCKMTFNADPLQTSAELKAAWDGCCSLPARLA